MRSSSPAMCPTASSSSPTASWLKPGRRPRSYGSRPTSAPRHSFTNSSTVADDGTPMKITKLEAFPLSIKYTRKEVSALIAREGVSDVIVKLTADNGLVGWGEACMNSETIGIQKAVEAAAPFVVGRDPWDSEAIARDFFIGGGWQFQAMTGSFAFAGIDMALWDLMGKEAGQPIYRMFGGAQREEVRYFYYLHWGTPDEVGAQCDDAVRRKYDTYYFKVGVDTAREESLLAIIRERIGKERFLRVDANQAWTVP